MKLSTEQVLEDVTVQIPYERIGRSFGVNSITWCSRPWFLRFM